MTHQGTSIINNNIRLSLNEAHKKDVMEELQPRQPSQQRLDTYKRRREGITLFK
jgi:hypothetical protein